MRLTRGRADSTSLTYGLASEAILVEQDMRKTITVTALLLAGFTLGGCIASTESVGVLPRDPVPPPPSVSGQGLRGSAATQRAGTTTQRRTLSVPNQAASPRP
jgi:hypothetical protein